MLDPHVKTFLALEIDRITRALVTVERKIGEHTMFLEDARIELAVLSEQKKAFEDHLKEAGE